MAAKKKKKTKIAMITTTVMAKLLTTKYKITIAALMHKRSYKRAAGDLEFAQTACVMRSLFVHHKLLTNST